jgi:hypothetical protein
VSSANVSTAMLGTLPTFTHRGGDCSERSDPINLIFPAMDALSVEGELMRRVNVDIGERWRSPGVFGSGQSLTTAQGCRMQDIQLVAGGIWNRLHVRLWNWSGRVGCVGSGHREYGITLGLGWGNALHRPSSFETARDSVFEDLTGNRRPDHRFRIDLENYQREPYASGEAAVIP